MKDVVLNKVVKELFYIQEDMYQNIRKKMNKKDNYFSEKEMKNIEEITPKIKTIDYLEIGNLLRILWSG